MINYTVLNHLTFATFLLLYVIFMQSYTLASNKSLHIVELKHPGDIFHTTSLKAIQKTLEKKKQVLIFINKQGVHTGMVCNICWHIPYCNSCDIPIALHNNAHQQLFGLCPICQEVYATIQHCPNCANGTMGWYGIWIQHVAEYCHKQFGISPLIIQSSTASSYSKLEQLIPQASSAPIILATSLMQTPIVGPTGLIVVQNTLSNIPDYNSEYQNYLFLASIVGSYQADHILLQTTKPDHLIIQSLAQNNPTLFLEHDQMFKIKHNYPPYGELCILIYKHEVESALFGKVTRLFHDMLAIKQSTQYKDIELYAIPANIYKIYNKYRYQIIVKWATIRSFMDEVYTKLQPYAKWFKIDRSAQSFF